MTLTYRNRTYEVERVHDASPGPTQAVYRIHGRGRDYTFFRRRTDGQLFAVNTGGKLASTPFDGTYFTDVGGELRVAGPAVLPLTAEQAAELRAEQLIPRRPSPDAMRALDALLDQFRGTVSEKKPED